MRVYVDASEVITELERLQQPDFDAISHLETALAQTFTFTQAQVHVITGSLRGSGKTWSDFDGKVWTGGISYGGPSMGFPNDPVEYAFYEWRRGGSHDFFGGINMVGGLFSDAMVEGHLEE